MFEWDEAKRLRVLEERGLDFRDAEALFDGRPMTFARSRRNNEDRFVSTAEQGDELYTVVWAFRGENQRIITFRRAHDAEARAYREVYG
jgi:uncharacterized DUF497 family protein